MICIFIIEYKERRTNYIIIIIIIIIIMHMQGLEHEIYDGNDFILPRIVPVISLM